MPDSEKTMDPVDDPGTVGEPAHRPEGGQARLEAFEAMLADVERRYADVVERMEPLRAAGKVKTVTYQQYAASKLQLQAMLAMYDFYGLR